MMLRNAYLCCLCTLFFAFTAHAGDFAAWQKSFAIEARKAGISEATLERHFFPTTFSESVITLDRKQPENNLGYGEYLGKSITAQKIKKGREMARTHATLLKKIGDFYQVDPAIIVALWGIETDYGQNTGNTSTLSALATLAYEGRRHELFSGELMTLLKLLQDGEIHATNLRGSWAGAMGQTQFMPSSFARYAVDYDKDGYKDIWNTPADVFASIANYLAQNEWQYRHRSIAPVTIPVRFDPKLADLTVTKTLAEWAKLGVVPENAEGLKPDEPATLLALDREKGEYYSLVFPNFKVLLDWNYSRLFAGAALHLAHQIEGKS